ncbi:hypothetical protein V1478_013754 [Vespula squamosa]|uniref:Uncharacterized protein n=1 Tax=Vespula squamosa TaxID=30214 RepID=A0ABD2A628_VESSQ
MKRMQQLVGDQVDNHRTRSVSGRDIGTDIRIRIVLGGLVQFVSCNLEGIIIDGKEWSGS